MSQTETEAQEEALAQLRTGSNTCKALAYFMRVTADRLEAGDESIASLSVSVHEERGDGSCSLKGFTLDECNNGHMGLYLLNTATDLLNSSVEEEKYGGINEHLEAWILKEIREGRLTMEGLEALMEEALD